MNTRLIRAIFRKELLETVRDRRTLFIMLIFPIFLYPALLVGVGQVVTHQVSQLTGQNSRVAILGEAPADLANHLGGSNADSEAIDLELVEVPPPPTLPKTLRYADDEDLRSLEFLDPALAQWAFAQIRANAAEAFLVFEEGAAATFAADGTANAVVLFDATSEASQQASNRIDKLLFRMQKHERASRLAAHPELPPGFNKPFRVAWENLAPPARQGNYVVARVLPTLLMMMVLLGAFYPAVDLTAGEKERGTLQTLITSPARPVDLIAGKFLAVFTVSMVAAIANLLSMAAAFTWLLADMMSAESASFGVPLGTILVLLVQLIPVGGLVSAGMLAVCVFARSYKEAQHYLTPIYVFLLVPIVLSALPGVTLTTTTAWMPALNVMLLIRTALLDPLGAELAVMVFVANSVWAALALVLAVRVFESEEVLLGGDGAAADAFRIRPSANGNATPTLTLAIVSFCLGMVLLVYAGGGLQKLHLIGGMLATQWLLIAATSILIARGFRLGLIETFSWRRPAILAVVGAIFLGAGAWAGIGGIVAYLQEMILPVPESFAKQMSELLGLSDNRYPLWLMLLTFAVTPAICEELFFRGLFMAGLRAKLGKWTTIIICGIGFGLFHLSIYRIASTAVLGMVLAWVLWETRSIIPCMILHACNNAAALCVAEGLLPEGLPNPVADGSFQLSSALPWTGLCLVGIILIYLGRAKTAKAPDPAPL